MQNQMIDCIKMVRDIRDEKAGQTLEEIVKKAGENMEKNAIWQHFKNNKSTAKIA